MLGAAWTLYSGEPRGNGNSLYRPKVGTRFGNTSRSCRQAFARFCELNIELILSNARGYSYNAYGRVEGL